MNLIKFSIDINKKDKNGVIKKYSGFPKDWQNLSKSKLDKNKNGEAILTGKVNNIIVIDFDKEEGMYYFNKYKKLFEDTFIEDSTNGYKHAYFIYDDALKSGVSKLSNKIDILSDGKCCVSGKKNNDNQIQKINSHFKYLLLNGEDDDINSNVSTQSETESDISSHSNHSGINQKYYELLNLLDNKYFNHYDKWMKPAYALYYCNELNNDVAFNTWDRLLQERSNKYNHKEALKCWNDIKNDTITKFRMPSIKKLVSEFNNNNYSQWNNKYNTKTKNKSLTKSELEEELLNNIFDAIKDTLNDLDDSIIRENNNIEFNDLVINTNECFTPEKLALLIKQTIIRCENNGNPLFYVKEIIQTKNKQSYIEHIKYSPRDPKMLKHYKFTIGYDNEEIKINFLDILDQIKANIVYRNVVLEPYGVLSTDMAYKNKRFNLFNGYLHKYDNEFKVNYDIVNVWLNHLKNVISNKNEDVYNHLLYYFKHILISPDIKTGLLIIIKGLQGSGKNSVFDIFFKFVMGSDTSLTTAKMDLITGRFNSIRQSLIMCVLDEAVDNKNKKQLNEFKNLITSETTQIEYKGKEALDLADYCNYIILSNNDFSSFIEESDRRSLCLETNNEYVGNNQYFNDYYNTLDNLEAGKHIFHYLINDVKIPQLWRPQDIPNTKYKKELKQLQANSAVKFFLDEYNYLSEEYEEYYDKKEYELANQLSTEEYKYETSELFDKYVSYCERNKYKTMSSKAFAHCSKNYVESGRTSSKRYKIYSLNILKEKLKAYL